MVFPKDALEQSLLKMETGASKSHYVL